MFTSGQALEIAEKTAAWINQYEQKTAAGICWSRIPERPKAMKRNIYHGSGGIALFFLELYKATGKEDYKAKAHAAGRDIAAYVKSGKTFNCTIFIGWPSYGFGLGEIGKACDDPELLDAAAFCFDQLRGHAREIGSGLGFIEEMPFSDITGHKGEREIYDVTVGAAGSALALIHAAEQGYYDKGIEFAKGLCDRLLEVAEEREGGLAWGMMNDIPWNFDAPNFGHGGAGVGFALARLYQHVPDEKYLDAAKKAATYLQSIALPVGKGHLVQHTMHNTREGSFYLGQCHGPAGTARLFTILSQITGDRSWEAWGEGLTDGLVAHGAPEQRGFGLWNNVSQCCCDAGIGDHALFLYRRAGKAEHLDLAQRIATSIMAHSATDETTGNLFWPQAEHRARPDFVETQTGYMQGAAGVGSFFVHLASCLDDRPIKILFADAAPMT